ncbi:MAG TPA: MFS transporter [Chloroflexota bacterium]
MRQRDSTPNWRSVLIAVCIAQATAIIGFDFTLPFVPLYLQTNLGIHGMAATAMWAGLIGFGPAIPATIFGPFWGRLADRYGYRTMLLRAMLCASILLTLMGFSTSPWILLVLRMIQGALTGTVFSAQALVAASVPEEETARSMGLLQMSVYMGATMGPIGGGAVAQAFGFRPAFWSAGVLLLAATSIVYVFVRDPASSQYKRAKKSEERVPLISLLAIPSFLGAVVMTLVVQFAGTSVMPVIPLFVQQLLHNGRQVAGDTGWVMAAAGLSAAAGSYWTGRLQRRFRGKLLLFVLLVVASVLIVPQALAGSFWAFLTFRCLAACAYGGLFALVGTWAAAASPRHAKGAAFGLIGAASSLGFGAGPLLGGMLAASFGIRALFLISAVVLGAVPAGWALGAIVARRVRSGETVALTRPEWISR